jgi:hypothetical protein
MKAKSPPRLLPKLIPCPTCKHPVNWYYHQGFWEITCNRDCEDGNFATHRVPYYAALEWRRQCQGELFGRKILVEEDYFPA